MDRLDNSKIVSGSDSKSVQVWEFTVGCSASASTMESRSIQGGTVISNTTQDCEKKLKIGKKITILRS